MECRLRRGKPRRRRASGTGDRGSRIVEPRAPNLESRRYRRGTGSARAVVRAAVRVVKLAVVVQRYGADINGGAELHARYIAERLSRHASVEVVTTCARDYVTWKNELPAGVEQVNGISVRRFPVAHERKPNEFGRRSVQVFDKTPSIAHDLR